MSHGFGLTLRTARTRVLYIVAILFVWEGFGQTDASRISAIESDTDRWIELQSQIAKSKNDWQSERKLLEGSIQILEAEQLTLTRGIESNEEASKIYTANRDRMQGLVDENREGLEGLVEPLRTLETKLKLLLPRLPEPLRKEVRTHLAKVDAANAPVTSRTQSLVASFTAIDRFSNSLTSRRVARPGPEGGEVSVRVLYWGLAIAYGLDEANGRAWIIQPSASGWEWQQRDGIFAEVLDLIESYETESEDPHLIEVPASLG
ncbi:DUF3450 family protein [Pelagicoccus sp. SDUM812002]|uniref:DUF3450 family protein n=1 Tax=Pelagicoccus sp. SDUM812002 TaxID=3041266 RepID=UPI0028108CFE|nr:DUF3450 family protein [Pelagicoccus sp. SDUM812002]MDQ8184794.1 DUF3450 family protein [Pelagicoccus sp. SDUM812002]